MIFFSVRPELVEGLFFLEEVQGFDRLSPNGIEVGS